MRRWPPPASHVCGPFLLPEVTGRHGLGGRAGSTLTCGRRRGSAAGSASVPLRLDLAGATHRHARARRRPRAPPSLRFSPCGGGRLADARLSSQDSRTRAGRLWLASRAPLRPGGSTRSAGGRAPARRPGPAAPSGAGNGAALGLYTNAIRCRDRSRDGERSPPTAAPTPLGAAPVAPGSREARRRLFCRGQLALSALSDPSAGRKPQAGRCAERKRPQSAPSWSPGGGHRLLAKAVADSLSPSMCAGFFRCPRPAPTADGRRQLVGQLSAVARADGSLALAALATRYGAAGMSMWNQRDRSLVPCSLMALMR